MKACVLGWIVKLVYKKNILSPPCCTNIHPSFQTLCHSWSLRLMMSVAAEGTNTPSFHSCSEAISRNSDIHLITKPSENKPTSLLIKNTELEMYVHITCVSKHLGTTKKPEKDNYKTLLNKLSANIGAPSARSPPIVLKRDREGWGIR